jgi:hypothetical protein
MLADLYHPVYILKNLQTAMSNSIKGFVFLLFIVESLVSFSAAIRGYEPDYAGKKLVFKTYTDPVTKNETELFTLFIDPTGRFHKEIELDKITWCHSEFGVYKGLLMLEPHSEVTLKLPPLREKTLPESRNPYFEPISVWLQMVSEKTNEAHNLISALEERWGELSNAYFNQLYRQHSTAFLDTVTTKLIQEFGSYQQPPLPMYLQFKLKFVEANGIIRNQQTVFKGIDPANFSYSNPAFSDLLDLVFTNKLSFEVNDIKGEELRKAILRADIHYIKSYFQKRYHLHPVLADLILLKLLHDAYYSGQFPEKSLLSMLESPFFLNNPDHCIRETAIRVKQKILFLTPGTRAPVICLNNLEGESKCSDQSGKYTYLLFADTEMRVCREHLKYLVDIHKKFSNELDFFLVIRNSDPERIKRFFSENEVPGTVVCEEPDNRHAEIYKIKSYPSAFLLDHNHTVVQALTKNPLDGFAFEFASWLRSEQIKKIRDQK